MTISIVASQTLFSFWEAFIYNIEMGKLNRTISFVAAPLRIGEKRPCFILVGGL